MDNSSRAKNPIFEILIAAGATVITMLLTGLYYVPALLLPFIAAFIAARHDIGWTVAYYVFSAACLFLMIPNHWWICAIALLLASLPCGIAIKKKVSAYEAIIISCAGWLLAAAALLLYVYKVVGTDILTFATDEVNALLQDSPYATSLFYIYARSGDIMSGTLTYETFLATTHQQMLKYIASEDLVNQLLGYYIPVLTVGAVVVGGFLSYLSARAVAKARGTDVQRIPPFERFYLPRKVSKYFLLLYIISCLPSLFNWENYYIAGYVLSTLVNTVFLIQGISFMEYLFKRKIKRRFPRILLVTGIALTVSGLLSYVGLFEQIVRIRDAKFTTKKNNGGNQL